MLGAEMQAGRNAEAAPGWQGWEGAGPIGGLLRHVPLLALMDF